MKEKIQLLSGIIVKILKGQFKIRNVTKHLNSLGAIGLLMDMAVALNIVLVSMVREFTMEILKVEKRF